MSEIKINPKILLENNLTLEQYFIMYCIYSKDYNLLTQYIEKCNSIDFRVVRELAALEYIHLTKETSDDLYFGDMTLTDKGMRLFGALKQSGVFDTEALFNEFKDSYPKSVREGRKIRRLHGNIKKCKELYSKLLSEVPHEILCRCARMYHKEMRQAGSEIYMQMLETWLNQRNYQQYLSEIESQDVDKEKFEEGGFSYDI